MHLYMICCLIVVTLLLLKTISVLLSPLRTVRGPLIARFTDLWYLWRVKQGRFEYENIALHEKYGPVVRYGSNRYSLNHPDAIKAIYGPASRLPKSSWYDTWASPGQWTIFADRSIKRHADNKRMYQNAFSMTTLVQYESFVDECSDLFVRRLEEAAAGDDDDDDVTKKSSSTADMDIGHWFHCYAFDVIGQITYAERLGFMETGQDVGGLMAMLSGHIEYATLTGIYSWLHPYLFAWRNYWAGSKGSGRQFIVNFTQNKMAENNAAVEKAKSKSTGDQPDHDPTECMLAKFAAKHTAQPDAFTKFHVLAGCVSNMVAGSDTTSLSLSAILYYLLRNPACLAKLHGEIDGLHRKGLLSTSPTLQETQGMPYLQAVIKEALRLHPAGGLPLERVVAEGGLKIGDTFFPEGTIVGINAWVEHRNTDIFGANVEDFDPERWLIEDTIRVAEMNRHWMPFGLGSRTCIGKNISILEMSKLIPRILRDFEFKLAGDATTAWKTKNFWFVTPTDFRVSVQRRRP